MCRAEISACDSRAIYHAIQIMHFGALRQALHNRSRRFLAVQGFYFCEQFGETYPSQECPQVYRVAKAVSKVKSTKKADKKKDNEVMDIGFCLL
jgi:hypothetical protein